MANPVLGKSQCSDCFFLGQDFAVRTVSMEMVQSVYFCLEAKPANSKFATKTVKKKKTNIFKCKPPEVHFTIRKRVPYNKLLTNLAFSSLTGEY